MKRLIKTCEYNAFINDCKKVKEKDMPNSYGYELPDGYVTDGYGNLYKLPTNGYSKTIKKDGLSFKYDYNNRLLIILDDNGEELSTYGLSATEWVENPDYWIDQAIDEIEEEANSFIKDELPYLE